MRFFNWVFRVFCGFLGHPRWVIVTDFNKDGNSTWRECLVCGHRVRDDNGGDLVSTVQEKP